MGTKTIEMDTLYNLCYHRKCRYVVLIRYGWYDVFKSDDRIRASSFDREYDIISNFTIWIILFGYGFMPDPMEEEKDSK